MEQWQLGDFAIAQVTKNVYAKVKVVKDTKGVFRGKKVLGLSGSNFEELNQTLCYHVESCRHKATFWIPVSSLQLAVRARPYYGRKEKPTSPMKVNTSANKKRKVREEVLVELGPGVASANKECDLNVTYEKRHLPARMPPNYENAFKEFVRRGKEVILDTLLQDVEKEYVSQDCIATVFDEGTSTEEKFEALLGNLTSLKEVDSYLYQCWRYHMLYKEADSSEPEDQLDSSPVKTEGGGAGGSGWAGVTQHTAWCLVCAGSGSLRQCTLCPAAFHTACRKGWIIAILHRKNLPREIQQRLSRTRPRRSQPQPASPTMCPGCEWGPGIGYGDVVWHKLSNCPWWPAKVLAPGDVPSCLLSRKHTARQWPLRYYGTLNYSWGTAARMCMFLPSHAEHAFSPDVHEAVLDACDDYIRHYLA